MAKECDGTSMPLQCVRRFEEGTRVMAETAEQIRSMDSKVDKLCMAVLGDGDPACGLAFRVTALEKAETRATKTSRRWKNRLWQIVHGILLLLAGVAFAMVCSGCMRPPAGNQAIVKPAETIEAPATVTADEFRDFRQEFTQFQHTTSTQIQNYALDERRADMQEKQYTQRLAAQVQDATQDKALMAGFLLVMAVAPAFVSARWRPLGYAIGVGLMVLAIAGPMLMGWLASILP